jgi:hypothetical protein
MLSATRVSTEVSQSHMIDILQKLEGVSMHLLRIKHSWIVHAKDSITAVILKISHLDLICLSLLVNLLFLALFVVPNADEIHPR